MHPILCCLSVVPSVIVIFIISLLFFTNDLKAQQNPNFEDISITVQIEGFPFTYNIAALYSEDEKLYVSVEELFQVLVIPCNVKENGDILQGFIDNEKRLYEINYLTRQISEEDKIIAVENGLVKNMGMLYLESSLFEKSFGLNISFNFRGLSIKVASDFELPLLKKQRLEKSRDNIRNTTEEFNADQTLKREYHLFRFGNLDWSLMSSQTPGSIVDSRLGLNLGAELLFGEVDAFLNFSNQNKPDPRQQQFYWKWTDNDQKIVRQIQVGNISNITIASVNAPVRGASITNTPTTVRKARGEYIISDVTQPDWMVELYINNALIDYTKADAAGLFMFKVPVVYGYTVLKLKFYGPMGEERSEERVMNVPANFMPAGVFEYKISGGKLQDDGNHYLTRGEGNIGITRSLTIGGGVEYLSTITNLSAIPFVSVSMLPIPKLILTGEYAHKVRTKALLNYYLWSNSMLEIDYTRYAEGQKAILFNYLEERKVSFSIPARFKSFSGSTRITYKQNVFKDFNYNMVDLMFSAFYGKFNANLSTYANWINDKPLYININAALSARLPRGFSFRPSAQFNLTKYEIMSFKAELEKKVFKSGYCSFSYERNIASDFNSISVSFKYDFSFAQTNVSVRAINKDISLLESVRGGIALDDKNKRVFPSQQSMVGRGGIALIPFVDVNHNNVFDPGERKADFMAVKINGGRSMYSEKDSIVRVLGLEPFIYYNVELDDKDFEFITWRLMKKKYRILVDPNQVKTIEIPVSPVAEITGMVIFDSDSTKEGLGRVVVNIFDKDSSIVTKVISESDGYVNYLGLLPGEYVAKIDSVQLSRIQMKAIPTEIKFTIKAMVDGDVYNGIDFVLRNQKKKLQKIKDTSLILIKNPIKTKDGIIENQLMDTIQQHPADNMQDTANIQKVTTDTAELLKYTPEKEDDLIIENQMIDTISKPVVEEIQYPINNNREKEDTLEKINFNPVKTEHIINSVSPIDSLYAFPSDKAINSDSNNKLIEIPELILSDQIENDSNVWVFGDICLQKGYFYIQCGAYRDKRNAIQMATRLIQNTEATIGIVLNKGLFKVQLGCFPKKSKAVKHKLRLENKKICEELFIGIRK